jgi:hypothetical protein
MIDYYVGNLFFFRNCSGCDLTKILNEEIVHGGVRRETGPDFVNYWPYKSGIGLLVNDEIIHPEHHSSGPIKLFETEKPYLTLDEILTLPKFEGNYFAVVFPSKEMDLKGSYILLVGEDLGDLHDPCYRIQHYIPGWEDLVFATILTKEMRDEFGKVKKISKDRVLLEVLEENSHENFDTIYQKYKNKCHECGMEKSMLSRGKVRLFIAGWR